MTGLIIAGGFIADEFTLDFVTEHTYGVKIAVDRGMEFFCRNHLTPDVIVGDFDSVRPDVLEHFRRQPDIRILHFAPEKDETDTELAIRTAMEQGCGEIHLLGATGSRMDHLLGNLHLLGMALKQQVICRMIDPWNRIRLLDKGIRLKKEEQYGTYVSLLPFTPEVTGLTLKGFKYPLSDYRLECFHSLGVSNEIVEEEAEITFRDGILTLIESRDSEQKI